jgi:tRNA isopentenyl-2-thiomethyl-A-37 hydroxylase MiaE
MADPTLEVYTPRKRGRPRAVDKLLPITIWISEREHDRIAKMARYCRGSMSATARGLLHKSVIDIRETKVR